MRITVDLGRMNCDGIKCGKATFVMNEQCNIQPLSRQQITLIYGQQKYIALTMKQ